MEDLLTNVSSRTSVYDWYIPLTLAPPPCRPLPPCLPASLSRSFHSCLQVMIYWTTNTLTSSMRLYKEALSSRNFRQLMEESLPHRVALVDFPKEILRPPRQWVEWKFTNIARFARPPRGGHFAALEQPGVIVSELEAFIKSEEALTAEVTSFLKDWVREENAQEEDFKMRQMEQAIHDKNKAKVEV
jgi:hypothetical protein